MESQTADVLLVESDDLIRHALTWLLGSDRRECVAVASAEEAQQLLAVHEPALVVTDLNLSGRWSGIDLLAWMWSSSRLRGIPMLLMTGDNPDEARALLSAAGLDHVELLPKPFQRVQLKERLALLTGRRGGDGQP
ncbi:MAG TPA: response regulator [Polyangia bacterium]|nr:response regulator [Polyangia bacterium]